jgi:hypothetical protein
MKRSAGFDARRLRDTPRRSWASRLGSLLGLLLVALGVLAMLLGAVALLRPEALTGLTTGREGAMVMLVMGFLLLWGGVTLRRRVLRRLLKPDELSLSPRLMKKRH